MHQSASAVFCAQNLFFHIIDSIGFGERVLYFAFGFE
jgi:hypothetical protein